MISLIVKVIGTTLKLAAFAAVVLVASHLIRWDGRTISDQVKTSLSSEEPKAWMKRAEKGSKTIIQEAKVKAEQIAENTPAEARAWLQAQKESADSNSNPRSVSVHEESISDTEKSELSSLIQR